MKKPTTAQAMSILKMAEEKGITADEFQMWLQSKNVSRDMEHMICLRDIETYEFEVDMSFSVKTMWNDVDFSNLSFKENFTRGVSEEATAFKEKLYTYYRYLKDCSGKENFVLVCLPNRRFSYEILRMYARSQKWKSATFVELYGLSCQHNLYDFLGRTSSESCVVSAFASRLVSDFDYYEEVGGIEIISPEHPHLETGRKYASSAPPSLIGARNYLLFRKSKKS